MNDTPRFCCICSCIYIAKYKLTLDHRVDSMYKKGGLFQIRSSKFYKLKINLGEGCVILANVKAEYI